MHDAFNKRDIEALVGCFSDEYDSKQPAHPDRSFKGREQVRKNWSAVFNAHADFHAELLRFELGTDAVWAEWYWHGTRPDGTELNMSGVTIFGTGKNDLIAWGRLYMEPVEVKGRGIDAAVVEVMQPGDHVGRLEGRVIGVLPVGERLIVERHDRVRQEDATGGGRHGRSTHARWNEREHGRGDDQG